MAYRLPPLNSLRLFEAAGRHLSFKAAAEELNLTPSAISHGVLTLEAWLGVDLFLRGNRTLTLTAAGAAYLPQVRAALEMIVGASNAVPGRKPTGRLAVSVSPTFGVRWLLPRLVRFSDRHPDIEVSVDTNHRLVEFPRDGIDVAIRMGRGDWPGLDATCLVRKSLVPVCAPRLAAKIRSADDLASKVLLHVVDAREDWGAWSKLAGVDASAADPRAAFRHHPDGAGSGRGGTGHRHGAPAAGRSRTCCRPAGSGARPAQALCDGVLAGDRRPIPHST